MTDEYRVKLHLRFRCTAVWILLALGSCGCGNRTGVSDGAAGEVPTDQSLTVEQYTRLGVPPPDRDWSGEDMANAKKVLTSLSQKGYGQLPRYESERSGAVFARLVSAKNLEPFRDQHVPIKARLGMALDYTDAQKQLYKLYLSAFLAKSVGDSEVIEFTGAMLRYTVLMIELVDAFMPTLDKSDPTYPVRMQGLEQARLGNAEVVKGGLKMLTEAESYRISERVKLLGYMQETFPAIIPSLLPAARTESVAQLEKMQDDPALRDLQPGLGELLAKMKASLKQGKVR